MGNRPGWGALNDLDGVHRSMTVLWMLLPVLEAFVGVFVLVFLPFLRFLEAVFATFLGRFASILPSPLNSTIALLPSLPYRSLALRLVLSNGLCPFRR